MRMVDEPLLEDADEPPVAIQKMSWMSLDEAALWKKRLALENEEERGTSGREERGRAEDGR